MSIPRIIISIADLMIRCELYVYKCKLRWNRSENVLEPSTISFLVTYGIFCLGTVFNLLFTIYVWCFNCFVIFSQRRSLMKKKSILSLPLDSLRQLCFRIRANVYILVWSLHMNAKKTGFKNVNLNVDVTCRTRKSYKAFHLL